MGQFNNFVPWVINFSPYNKELEIRENPKEVTFHQPESHTVIPWNWNCLIEQSQLNIRLNARANKISSGHYFSFQVMEDFGFAL